MHTNDHNPPHFHVQYGDEKAMIAIGDSRILKGKLARKSYRLVVIWASQHQNELREAWARRERSENPGKIPPLR